MLDRVYMACPQCGSRSSSVVYESSQEDPNGSDEQRGLLRMSVLCDSGHVEYKWVHAHAVWNLLRSFCVADRMAAARIFAFGSRCSPSRWKLWRIGEEITGDEARRRHRLVRQALRLVLPDGYTWFNGYESYGVTASDWEESFFPSGTAYTRYTGYSCSFSEWQALRLAVLSVRREKVFATDVSPWLIKLVGYPLAR
jgi:hypothetical protein